MAAAITFTCKKCGYQIESWDDGNPYIETPRGKRYHFYHPCEDSQIREIVQKILKREPTEVEISEMLQNNSGNEGDYLCLECLKLGKRDSDKDNMICRSCKSNRIIGVGTFSGQKCPKCNKGKLDKGECSGIS